MKKKHYLCKKNIASAIAVFLLLLVAIDFSGCAKKKKPAPPQKPAPVVKKEKEQPVEKTPTDVTVLRAAGVVKYSADGKTFVPVVKDTVLKEGYSVSTEADGKAVLSWFDGNLVKLAENSTVKIAKIGFNPAKKMETSQLTLEKGRVFARAKALKNADSTFTVRTPVAIAGVRGTQFVVEHGKDKKSSGFKVVEGSISVGAKNKEIIVGENFQVDVEENQAPGAVIPIPEDVRKLLEQESMEIEELVKVILILKERREKLARGEALTPEEEMMSDGLTPTERKQRQEMIAEQERAEAKKLESYNVMLAAVDGQKNSHLILISHVMPSVKKVALISVPVEAFVQKNNDGLPVLLKDVFVIGGAKGLVQAVEKVTGMPIRNYVFFNAETAIAIIDAVGGVDIEVEKDLYYINETIPYAIDMKKGKQHLDGLQAVTYAKFKYDDEGMKGSVRRQKQLMQALAKSVSDAGSGRKLPQMIEGIVSGKALWTDVKKGDSALLGDSFDKQMLATLSMYDIPSKPTETAGFDYMEIDMPAMNKMMEKMGRI